MLLCKSFSAIGWPGAKYETIRLYPRLFIKLVFAKIIFGRPMHYLLTEEQKMIVDICRQIVDERIKPV
ncbi:MAG: hypothetical protein MUP02_06160, partial [Actinobacteria bacterium]|nr:hypothetical protein [Actinomycetota bacterium]